MLPTIGRIVIYNTTEEERQKMLKTENCNAQEKLPAIVVATFEKTINLKVFVDGEFDIWKYGILQGINPGQWDWPIIQKENIIKEYAVWLDEVYTYSFGFSKNAKGKIIYDFDTYEEAKITWKNLYYK